MSSGASATDVPGTGVEFQARAQGLAGGVNLRDAPTQLEEDECLAIRNIILDERGGGSKRAGTTALASLTGNILSFHIFHRVSGSHQLIVHLDDGSIRYSTNWETGSPTFTSIATGKSTTAPYSFETYLSRVYMSNGTNNYAKWDGTTFTELASNPKGKYLRLWKDAMWVTGVSGLEDRIYSSNVGDPDTFGASSWVDIFKGDGDQMMALAQDGQTLVCFKQRRTFFIYDPVSFANRLADPEKGCESHFSCIFFDGVLYFMSSIGICAYAGDGPATVMSGKIDPVFDPTILNYSALNTVWAYSTYTRVGWCVPEAGQSFPNMQIELYPRLEKRPITFHRIPVRAMIRGRKGSSVVMLGAAPTAALYRCFDGTAGTDDGAAFNAEVEVGWFDFGSPVLSKYIRRVRIAGRGKFEIQWRRDFGTGVLATRDIDLSSSSDNWTTGDTWGVGTWGPDSVVKTAAIHPDIYGRWFLIKLIDGETGLGTRNIDVGGTDYPVTTGEWALYQLVIQGRFMGSDR